MIRAVLRLGSFIFAVTGAGCATDAPDRLANRADLAHHTGVFSWLVTHQPAALVVRQVEMRELTPIVAGSVLTSAGSRPCAQAKRARAELLLLAPEGTPERDLALDCGLALFHDAGAIVIAPL